MKKLLFLLILFAVPLASAMNMTIDATNLDGDIDIYVNPDSTGNTTYYLDGVDYKDSINRIDRLEDVPSDKDRDIRSITNAYYTFSSKVPKAVNPNDIKNKYALRFKWVMDTYFMPRNELNHMFSSYFSMMQDLNFRLMVQGELHNETELCSARISVALREGINQIECHSEVYTFDGRNSFYEVDTN